ncbi:chaperonin 10-like protein [Truncatella angustata]|uniref:Chaperonin 10-like protein n=1 Tax=Truncatella angustata TaxID=152316 RepID=A0A9P8UHK5_9PEZI|nr:chaperonin 10-like protein [Truncatella angustata]KAH6652243.1 chaperonin 10-like protein [Truncatella angustata]
MIKELQPSTFTQRALIVNHERKYELRPDFATPAYLAEHEVKIRACAVGLNQIDYKSVDYNFCLPQLPWITGREMAGIVEEVGSSVLHLQPGHRVWTSTYYRDRRAGCFQDYVIVPQHTVSHMPSEMSFTDAACLGVCGLTAAMTLWRWFEIPLPYHGLPMTPPGTPPHKPADAPIMLIWGGSSVTGQFLTQLARRSGLRVVSVSSAKTAKTLLDLGAEHVVVRDGKSEENIVDEIKDHAGDDITLAVDLVGAKTAVAALRCLSTTRSARFAPLAWAPKMDVSENIEILNVEMKQFVLNPASSVYADHLTRLVDSGEIQLPEIEVLSGGLDIVEKGLERLKGGDMVGKKLVVDMLK